MKKAYVLLLAIGLLIAGCTDQDVIKPNVAQGPAGGERLDQTSPVAPASSSAGGQTATAFPATIAPTDKGANE